MTDENNKYLNPKTNPMIKTDNPFPEPELEPDSTDEPAIDTTDYRVPMQRFDDGFKVKKALESRGKTSELIYDADGNYIFTLALNGATNEICIYRYNTAPLPFNEAPEADKQLVAKALKLEP